MASFVCPTRSQSRYTEVHVLFISWEDGDLEVGSEIRRLRHVFKAFYRYAIEEYQIPSRKSRHSIQVRKMEFLKHDSPDHLLIVYYAGHAWPRVQGNEPPIWAAYVPDLSSCWI
jgi:hypothetical protein